MIFFLGVSVTVLWIVMAYNAWMILRIIRTQNFILHWMKDETERQLDKAKRSAPILSPGKRPGPQA